MTNPRPKVPLVAPPVIDRRPATEDDHEFLFAVFRAALVPSDPLAALPESESVALLRTRFDAREEQHRKDYPLADFDVLTVDGEPAGNLYVDRGDDEFVVIDISLLPEFRNRGIGTTVIGHLVEEAGRLVLPVRARVQHDSPTSRFWRRLGFEQVGDDGAYYGIAVPAIQPD